jgi:hypothetical protein
MVVQTYWPVQRHREVSEQVTDRIEKELMTTGKYEKLWPIPDRRVDGDFCAKDSLKSIRFLMLV